MKKQIWELKSPALILAAITVGYNKTDLIINKRTKKESENIFNNRYSKGFVPQGTFNKYKNLLEESGFIIHDETIQINKRHKESFVYRINLPKIIEIIKLLFNNKVCDEINKLSIAIEEIKNNETHLNKIINAHTAGLDKMRSCKDMKNHFDILTCKTIKVNINRDEIMRLEYKIKELKTSTDMFQKTIKILQDILKKMELLKMTQQDLIEKTDKEDVQTVEKSIQAIFYWRLLRGDIEFTLKEVITQFIESLQTGKAGYILFFGGYSEPPTTQVEVDLGVSLLKIYHFLNLRMGYKGILQ